MKKSTVLINNGNENSQTPEQLKWTNHVSISQHFSSEEFIEYSYRLQVLWTVK